MKNFDIRVPCDGNSFIMEMGLKAAETIDEFIFETVLPFCEEKTRRSISKQILIDALTEYFAKHGTEEEPDAEQS